MDILVLGGTSFVGRWIVEDLLARGHTPTLFTRGRTGAELFPGVDRLVGDRDLGDHDALRGRRWDAVVDVSGYRPSHVAGAIAALGEHRGRYLFISTGLVYDHLAATDEITEATPRVPAATGDDADEDYGALKVACEEVLQERFGDLLTTVRPGYVVGPHDPSDRFTWWVRRGGQGGRMPVPDRLERPIQVVDVRDLARLVSLLLEQDRAGAFNAVGPMPPITLRELVRACGAEDLVEVAEDEHELPLLLPDPSFDVLFRISAAAAHRVGMPCTPLAETIASTRAWDRARGEPPLIAGLSAAEERAALR